MILAPGARFRHYEVIRFLGAGLCGEVYEVAHVHTHARFALKVSHLADRRDARKVARSLIEAKGTYAIQHENVVRVHDLACEEDGLVWMLMELLEGDLLSEVLRIQGRLSPLYALHVAINAAWGLDAAHEAQTIHRDIKPGNLFVTTAGGIKVLDFSIAKVIPEGLQTTLGHVGKGTFAYMSPERFKSAAPSVGFDVYSLGITLWEMLAGHHPYQAELGDLKGLMARLVRAEVPALPPALGLRSYFDGVLGRALAKDPAARFRTMAEMAQAMMGVEELVGREMAEGRMSAVVPRGEPAIVRDPRTRSDYSAPTSLPVAYESVGVPSARVVAWQPDGAPSTASYLKTEVLPVFPVMAAPGVGSGEAGVPTVRAGRAPGRRSRAVATTGVVMAALLLAAVGVATWWWAGARQSPHLLQQDPRIPPASAASSQPRQ